jgi:thiamine biosynthesis lipoprotein
MPPASDLAASHPVLRPRVEKVMGTAVGITAVDGNEPDRLDGAFEWLHWVDAAFSTYREDSEVRRIGRGELSLDDASPEVRHVFARCGELETATGGRFTMLPGRPEVPGPDPSGLVKGWSIDEAALILQVDGIERFMINAGGDILCVGEPPRGTGWPIGIRHPLDSGAVAAVLTLPAGAVATSGTYERGSHIWGRRGEARLLSATVIGPDLGTTDALATAVFVDPNDLGWMGAFPGYELVLIGEDHTVRWTPGLDGIISLEDESGASRLQALSAETPGMPGNVSPERSVS